MIKRYNLVLLGDEPRVIRGWNTGNPRADLTAALELAGGYDNMGCKMAVFCNTEMVWSNF